MKKVLLLIVFLLGSLVLTACGTTASTSEKSADNWFNPTPPEEIKLASGQLQFFEFSAVW